MAQPRYRLSRSIIYGYFPTGVKWLLIVNTGIFVIWYLGGPTVQSMMSPLVLVPQWVVHRFPWFLYQLVTYLFLHGGISHILFNMLALWMFGTPIEQTWGTRRFLKYYFLCGIGAGICAQTLDAARAQRRVTGMDFMRSYKGPDVLIRSRAFHHTL